MRFLLLIIIFTTFCSRQLNAQSFEASYTKILEVYNIDGLIDYERLSTKKDLLKDIYKDLEILVLDPEDSNEYKSQMINVYNFLVLHQVSENYPIHSVKKIAGFFNRNHQIGSKNLSLDEIEKSLTKSNDPRMHFALVCGAKSCPTLATNIYNASELDQQLDYQSSLNCKRDDMIRLSPNEFHLNKIFDWYIADFQGRKGLYDFIKKYSGHLIEPTWKQSYQPYDWSLNILQGNELRTDERFYASNLYAKGQYEINFFNNYYTQRDKGLAASPDSRYDFLTSLVQLTYGWSEKLNLGLDFKFRSVSQNLLESGLKFEALKFSNDGNNSSGYQRIGLTAINLRVKYKPFKRFQYLTTQQIVSIPLLFNENDKGFIDWTGFSFQHQFIYDREVGNDFAIFLEGGFLIENINKAIINQGDGFNQYTLPFSGILSYFPTKDWTIYGLYGVAPQLYHSVSNSISDVSYGYYQQIGVAMKYFIHPKLQLEVLATGFYSGNEGRSAATYNLGLRYFRR